LLNKKTSLVCGSSGKLVSIFKVLDLSGVKSYWQGYCGIANKNCEVIDYDQCEEQTDFQLVKGAMN
jgi:hypothetical protein